MTKEEILAWVDEMHRLDSAHDADGLQKLYTDDVVLWPAGARGLDEVHQMDSVM